MAAPKKCSRGCGYVPLNSGPSYGLRFIVKLGYHDLVGAVYRLAVDDVVLERDVCPGCAEVTIEATTAGAGVSP